MKLYYFAHPYTGSGPNKILIQEANYKLCVQRTAKLFELGYMLFSPIVHTHPIETGLPKFLIMSEEERHKTLMNIDRAIITKTDFTGIILAPGWSNSKGCVEEKNYFEQLNKEILFYSGIIAEVKCHEF